MNTLNLVVGRNTAGAVTPVVDWLVENGHRAVILEPEDIDIFGLTSYSKNVIMTSIKGRNFFLKALEALLDRRPNVLHINTSFIILSFFRLFSPKTPLVFMYHGSEIRSRVKIGLHPRMEARLADKIIVSTRDLQKFGEWFDRPIPLHFRYTGGRKAGTALMLYADFFAEYGKDQRELARKVCDKLGLELTIREKRNTKPIPNTEMPAVYSQYEYYLDFKGHDSNETFAISKSGLEAMSCGCKVLHDIDPYKPLDPEQFLAGDALFLRYLKMYQDLDSISYWQVIPRLLRNIGMILMTPASGGYISLSNKPTVAGIKRLSYYATIFVELVFRRFWSKIRRGAKDMSVPRDERDY